MFCEVYHRIHPTFFTYYFFIFDYRAQTETDHRRKDHPLLRDHPASLRRKDSRSDPSSHR